MWRWFIVAAACGCGGSHAGPADADAAGDDVPAIDATRPPDAMVVIPPDADLSGPTDTPIVPCADTPAMVYAAVPQLGAPLGAILACAPDEVLDVAAVQAAVGAGVTVTSAVAQFRIAYQTRDGDGNPAVSTARVYLPSTPRARPVPLAVAAHGSVGIADSCVPSAEADNSLPMPYAGRGFATIAPDLAGLGNAGTQDYLDNRAQGWQLLDGARALRAILPPGLTAQSLVLTGFSQGAGAALSAHSLIRGDVPGAGTLVATVVYAPEWPIRLESFDYLPILRDPTQLTIFTGLAYSSVAVMRQYAFFEDHLGVGRGPESVPAQFRAGVESAIQSQCLIGFGGYIQTNMFHTGDLIDDTLRTGVLACVDGLGPAAGCTGDAAAYYQFLIANHLTPDPGAGPVWIVQGLGDLIMQPAKEASCIRDKMAAAGVDIGVCTFAGSNHSTIMDQHATGVAWAESVVRGDAQRAPCPESGTLPACQ